MSHWLTMILATFAGLLPIVNPFSTAAVFLALTGRMSDPERKQLVTRSCFYAAGVLLVFLFAGALLMHFFGISIPALRIAGGLIVARVGFGMLMPPAEDASAPPTQRPDIAFTPLAVPMLSGPGSIAVTIGMAAGAKSWLDHVAIAAGILLVIAVSWLVLRSARAVNRYLGDQGVDALTRIMGFLLVCIGVQFIVIGSFEVLADPKLLAPIFHAADTLRDR